MRKTKLERFLEKFKVVESGCWEWQAARDEHGYGKFGRGGGGQGWMPAHRWAYEHWVGPIPSGLVLRHTCDNPRCVNPDHLLLGTQKDNIHDMARRGRAWRRQLTEGQVRDILIRWKPNTPGLAQQLAVEYETSINNIKAIAQRHSWKWLSV